MSTIKGHKHTWNDFGCTECGQPVPYHLQPYTYRYELDLLEPEAKLPEPWRDHRFASNAFLLPLDFAATFADMQYLRQIERNDKLRIDELRHSMLTEGLRVPIIMVIDASGKLRYHDGYHRLSVMLENPGLFPYVPCVLNHSTGTIRAFGRNVVSEVETILKFLAPNAE